jgi:hypothetical protein
MNMYLDEWKQCMSLMQYFLDYRTKVFGFCATITSILLSVTLFHTSGVAGLAILALVGILVLISGIFADLRAASLADKYREAAIVLEEKLCFTTITQVHVYAKSHRPGLRHVFRALYSLLIVTWLVRLAASVL